MMNPEHRKKAIGLTRKTADELIRKICATAERINADKNMSRVIVKLTVFGSYLSDKEKLGDLDIAAEYDFRYPDANGNYSDKQRALDDKIRESDPRDYPMTIVARVCYPELLVLKTLKGGSRAISLHSQSELDAMIEEFPETKHKVIWTRNEVPELRTDSPK